MQPSIFLAGEHPDHPGWLEWKISDPSRFNQAVLGLVVVRAEPPNFARIRIFPKRHMTNMSNNVHGAIVLSLIDISLFAGPAVILEQEVSRGVTIELNNHFLAAADAERPLDAVLEVLKETGRMVFSRGKVVQGDDVVASFSGIIRKPPMP